MACIHQDFLLTNNTLNPIIKENKARGEEKGQSKKLAGEFKVPMMQIYLFSLMCGNLKRKQQHHMLGYGVPWGLVLH